MPINRFGPASPPAAATDAKAGPLFTGGFEACIADHLGLRDGTLLSRFRNPSADELSLVKTQPDDAFGVTINIGALDVEIMHDRRAVLAGRLPAGRLRVLRPGQHSDVVTRGRWDNLFICLPRTTVGHICESVELDVDLAQLEFRDSEPGEEPWVLDFARRVAREIDGTDAFARLRVDLVTQELVADMLSNHSSVADALRPARSPRGGLAPLQLRRAFDAMEGLLESDVTLTALAQAAGCSPTHFSRAFKQSTGMPPFAWLLHRRVERAQQLLQVGDLPIAEVALAVGFSAQPQFTTAFKRVTGVTPAAWRRNLR